MAEGTAKPGLGLTPLSPFDPLSDPTSLGQRWKTWKRRFQVYVAAMKIEDAQQKRALLLYQMGEATQSIFDTFTDTGDDYDTAMTKLDEYFTPKKNLDYEVFKFRNTAQMSGETIDQYTTRLRKLAANCDFTNIERELKSTIIQNCISKRLRRVALRDDLTLDALLAKGRSIEASEMQASGMEQSSTSGMQNEKVNKVSSKKHLKKLPFNQPTPPPTQSTQCRNCGLAWPHKGSPCPAKGQVCKACGKPNHFARVCRTKLAVPPKRGRSRFQPKFASRVHQVTTEETVDSDSEETDSSDDEYLFTLGNTASGAKTPVISVSVSNIPVPMMIDTGASTDIIDESSFSDIQRNGEIELLRSTKRIFAYGSDSQLHVLGQFTADICIGTKHVQSTIHVIRGNHGSLLSYKTACDLGIIDVKVNQIQTQQTSDELIKQFPHLFKGIGKLKDTELHLHIDDSVPPVAQRARRVPFHLRKQVSEELEQLERQGIIEKVNGATPWVSPLVVTPKKNGSVRLCVDMRRPNEAIRRERHPSPTLDDLIHILNGATVFSKLDLRSGYHQIPLAPESRHITTFATHEGLRCYRRLNFGTNSASEIFQNIIGEQLHNIPGSFNISDDVIIFGKTQADHDRALKAVFQKFSDVNLTLNKSKCEFNKPSISFFGFIFSKDGISPDPEKVLSIQNMSPPKSVSEVRSFLGMATYCAKFIPSFSNVSHPLRELTKKNSSFQWTKLHQAAFEKIKELLTSETTMAYFDPSKETELTTDASPVGLSAILSQRTPGQLDRRIVAYGSRSLSDVETRYSQTEKEALAIVWAVEHFHLYLYGKLFTLYTDCKPVQMILGNPKSKPPARIERWNLRLQSYNFRIVHTKGNQNPSDFLSRHTSLVESKQAEKLAEDYVNFLSLHAVPRAMTLAELQEATKADATLQYLIQVIRSGEWSEIQSVQSDDVDKAQIKLFMNIKDELTVNSNSNLVLRGQRIVLPTELQQRAVQIAHEGHQGLVKTKKLLREKVWFPGIDKMAKNLIQNCVACQANSLPDHPQPLQMTPLPPKPWHTVNVDFCGPFPTGEYLLVVIDAYSRFPEVEIVHSTAGRGTLQKLDRIFATHGIPTILKSDNGPPFFGEEFRAHMEENGIKHQKVTPLWPQANGEAESFMKPLTKAVRSAHAEGRDWKKELYRFLLNYRATPHSSTAVSPAELLFNRKISMKLPEICEKNNSEIQAKDSQAKQKMKEYADQRVQARESNINIGDAVLVRQKKKNKFTTKFDPSPYKVVEIKGTMLTGVRNEKYITRNISHFKKIEPTMKTPECDSDESDDDQLNDEADTPDLVPAVPVPAVPVPPPAPQPTRRYPARSRNPIHRYGQNIYDK